jgi:hypothetical protein
MRASERITLVASGPGRSGADTLLRILSSHPFVTAPEHLGPSMITAMAQLLVHASSDGEAWLPRRAAQALTDVVYRLDAVGDHGRDASAELIKGAQASTIDIPVYGPLLLPLEISLLDWGRLLHRALYSAAAITDGSQLALKTGTYVGPIVATLLGLDDSLICSVRHPAETVIILTESVVDGMRAEEAVDYISLHLGHAKRLLAAAECPTGVVRLEDLVSSTDAVLSELIEIMRLPDDNCWRQAVRTVLPGDIKCSPRWDHPAVRPYRAALAALANSWGYV